MNVLRASGIGVPFCRQTVRIANDGVREELPFGMPLTTAKMSHFQPFIARFGGSSMALCEDEQMSEIVDRESTAGRRLISVPDRAAGRSTLFEANS